LELYRRAFIPDTHIPYHDAKALEVAIEVIQDFRPHELVFLGDFFDLYCVSQYSQDPLKCAKVLQEEIAEGKELLNAIERRSKAKSVVFISGNHENRLDRYVAENGPRLAGSLSVREVLGIPVHWVFLPYGQKGHYRMGNWVATHGSICNKYSAAAMVAKYGCNVIYGHVHKIQRYQTADFSGRTMTGLTCGWLGDSEKAAEYVKNVPDYSHGLALGWWRKSGKGHIDVVPIEDYRAISLGRAYG